MAALSIERPVAPGDRNLYQTGPGFRARGSSTGDRLALLSRWRAKRMTNMVIYLIGTLLVVAGLAYGANRMGVSQVWIIAGALVIIGIGLMGGIVKTRQKDPAS